jgi:GNAT superfamily N-acetyltransferase
LPKLRSRFQAKMHSHITLRRAAPRNALEIGAVFDAAVRESWTFLGDFVREPMFAPADGVVGFAAAHPADCEMFLLFVHPAYGGGGIGRSLLAAAHDELQGPAVAGPSSTCRSRTSAPSPSSPAPATGQTLPIASRTFGEPRSASCGSSSSSREAQRSAGTSELVF